MYLTSFAISEMLILQIFRPNCFCWLGRDDCFASRWNELQRLKITIFEFRPCIPRLTCTLALANRLNYLCKHDLYLIRCVDQFIILVTMLKAVLYHNVIVKISTGTIVNQVSEEWTYFLCLSVSTLHLIVMILGTKITFFRLCNGASHQAFENNPYTIEAWWHFVLWWMS